MSKQSTRAALKHISIFQYINFRYIGTNMTILARGFHATERIGSKRRLVRKNKRRWGRSPSQGTGSSEAATREKKGRAGFLQLVFLILSDGGSDTSGSQRRGSRADVCCPSYVRPNVRTRQHRRWELTSPPRCIHWFGLWASEMNKSHVLSVKSGIRQRAKETIPTS